MQMLTFFSTANLKIKKSFTHQKDSKSNYIKALIATENTRKFNPESHLTF